MIYQHPLAYLLAIEGLALLRSWAGDFDRDFVLARLAEVRRLLDDPVLANHLGVDVAVRPAQAGYATAASTYDNPDNGLFALDEPEVQAILDMLAPGDALDAACGTGRLSHVLARRGYRVVGVDTSPEMLAIARKKVPEAEFVVGHLAALPVPDASADLIVCALALTHVADLSPVMAEFARVVRPGGHVVITDAHHELVLRGSVTKAPGPHGEPGRVVTHRHTPGDYLRAALPVGLHVRRCEERARPEPADGSGHSSSPEIAVGPWDGWPWTLLPLVPDAALAAWSAPAVIVWDFERTSHGEA